MKADALSCLFSPEETQETPETILPPNVVISPIQWSLDNSLIKDATNEPALPGCPVNCTYVPTSQRIPLIESAHSLVGTSHPRTNQNLSLPQKRFWWPWLAKGIRRFNQGCHLPSGKLPPLPFPVTLGQTWGWTSL